MSAGDLRAAHAPAETAAHQSALDAVARVHDDLSRNLHTAEMQAAHGCQPSPEAAVGRGVTPSSGGPS